jgi:photosystem II stability/assembly factor-like uncharacterized protein
MDYYVNVKSGATLQGSGPLTKVTEWSVTRRMDGAGEWSFRVATTAAQIAQLVLKRTCEIYAYIDTAYTYVGGGAIDRIERQIEPDGSEFLVVAGDDQLRELANRTTNQQLIAQDDILGDWYQIGNFGGRTAVTAMLARPGDVTVLAGTTSAGGEHIYRSNDSGQTWALKYTGGTTAGWAIECFADCGSGVVLAGATSGVYQSLDFGETWALVAGGIACDSIAFLGSSVAIFGDSGGNVYRSTDNGATWGAAIATGVGARVVTDILWLGGNVVVASSGNNYIARSTDKGVTWGTVTFPAGAGTVAYCLANPATNIVLAGTNTGYVARSTDNGVTWGIGVDIDSGASAVVRSLLVWGTVVVAGAGGKVYFSVDNGVTFAECGDLGAATATYALAGLSNNVLAGADDTAAVWMGTTVSIGLTHAAAVQALENLSPAGWDLVPDGTPTVDDIYIQFAGESVLAGALLVAERSGTHCYLSATQELTFTDTWTDSGIHAVNGPTAIDANTAAIASLMVEESTYDLVSRVYPYGKMADGTTLIGIGQSAISAGTGYTKSNASGYIENDSAIANYGIVERMVVFNEIVLADDTINGRVAVGDALVRAGKTYLERTCLPVTNYRLQLAGCAALLWPMQTIRITYTGDVVIDDTLYILDATWRGDGSGLLTAEITVADAPVRIEADTDMLARALLRVNGLAAR